MLNGNSLGMRNKRFYLALNLTDLPPFLVYTLWDDSTKNDHFQLNLEIYQDIKSFHWIEEHKLHHVYAENLEEAKQILEKIQKD
jgi:hypothetical protein